MKKIISIALCVLMLTSCAMSFTACNKDDDPNNFTFLLSASVDQTYYSDYNQNPAVLYALQREYAGQKITFDFKNLLSGSEKEQLMTMFSTGEYYDVMNISHSDYSPDALYDMGIAIDLTELIDKYMPNYKAWVTSNPSIENIAYYNVNGEKKAYALWSGADRPQNIFNGYTYRRDWIVKYGVNPSTGDPFTGGYTAKNEDGTNDANSWVDDIVFPSWYLDNKYVTEYKANHPEWDGTDPVFISDWEWMFEIFEKAFEDLGITNGYCLSIYYTGYMQTGDLYSGFGGGGPLFYYDYEADEVAFGATSDSMKAYLECMNSWYEKGWLDKSFDEHSSDMYYAIDNTKVRQGHVGMWQGKRSELNGGIESKEYPATEGVYAKGARMPINDIYGEESCKGKEPDSMYMYEYTTGSFIITTNASEKNLEALCTFIDSCYNYDDENIVSFTHGLNKEQYESIYDLQEKKDGKAIQEIYGLTEGNYTIEERDGQKIYVMCDKLKNDTYLRQASRVDGMLKLQIEKNSDLTAKENYDSIINNWMCYENKSYITGSIISKLSADDSKAYSKVLNNINTKMSVEIPKFIKGVYNLEEDFDTFAKTINKLSPQKGIDILNKLYE